MSDLAKKVDYFHVKVELSIIVVVEILVDHFIHIILSIVDKVGHIRLGYFIKVGLSKVKSSERFILHDFSGCEDRLLDMNMLRL